MKILKIMMIAINLIFIFICLYFKNKFMIICGITFLIYLLWVLNKWKKIEVKDDFGIKTALSIDIVLFLCMILCLRFAKIQIIDVNKYRSVVASQIEGVFEERGNRGKILDKFGVELAYDTSTYDLFVDPMRVIKNTDSKKAIKEIFEELKIKKSSKKFIEEINREGKKNRRYKVLTKNIDELEKKSVNQIMKKYKIKENEIYTKTKNRREYSNNELYKDIVGVTGFKGESTKKIGINGIEYQYEKYLNEKTIKKINVFAKNKKLVLPTANEKMEVNLDGKNLYLTLDNEIQYILNVEMKKKFDETKAEEAYAIIVNPNNGKIIATSNFTKNKKVIRNPLFQNQIEPGSIFKPIIVASALEDKYINKNTTFNVKDGKLVKYGYTIKEASKSTRGVLNLKEVLGKSSNISMILMSDKFSDKVMEKFLRNFGFYDKTGVDFPYEKKPYNLPSKKWDGLKKNTISFGQGIAVTPIQMVMAFSAIVNGGNLYKPYLVEKIEDSDGTIIRRNLPVVVKNPISEKTSKYMKELLEYVVEDGGGQKAKLESYRIGGKTGTAQISGGKSGYIKDEYLTSFIGCFPADKPEYVGLIMFYKPEVDRKYGGVVAAPVFKDVIKRITMNKEILSSDIKKINVKDYSSKIYDDKNKKNDNNILKNMPNLKNMTARQVIKLFENNKINIEIKGVGIVDKYYPEENTPLEKIEKIIIELR